MGCGWVGLDGWLVLIVNGRVLLGWVGHEDRPVCQRVLWWCCFVAIGVHCLAAVLLR